MNKAEKHCRLWILRQILCVYIFVHGGVEAGTRAKYSEAPGEGGEVIRCKRKLQQQQRRPGSSCKDLRMRHTLYQVKTVETTVSCLSFFCIMCKTAFYLNSVWSVKLLQLVTLFEGSWSSPCVGARSVITRRAVSCSIGTYSVYKTNFTGTCLLLLFKIRMCR